MHALLAELESVALNELKREWNGNGDKWATQVFLSVGGVVSCNKSWSCLALPHDVAVSTCMSNNWVTKSLLLQDSK